MTRNFLLLCARGGRCEGAEAEHLLHPNQWMGDNTRYRRDVHHKKLISKFSLAWPNMRKQSIKTMNELPTGNSLCRK